MKPSTLLPLLALLLSGIAHGQTEDYDISNYKARYDRRPQLFVDPGGNFFGNYAGQAQPNSNWSLGAFAFWRELRNTDQQIAIWQMSSNLTVQGSARPRPGLPNEESSIEASLESRTERLNYYEPDRFWSWGLTANSRFTRGDGFSNGGFSTFKLVPSISHGQGRLEFAEDALLANWILQDLAAAGVIAGYGPEDAEAIALTITDIIGDRTFDIRRRRMYQVERLYNTLMETGLVERESFPLFAAINDNWLFANRAFLRHGKQMQYGAELEANGRLTQPGNRSLGGGLSFFWEQQWARIRKNTGGEIWRLSASFNRYFDYFQGRGGDTFTESLGLQFVASAGYDRQWLPNSRTQLAWQSSLNYVHFWEGSGPAFSEQLAFRPVFLSSLFYLDYFIDYHWSFQLNAGLSAGYRSVSDSFTAAPSLRFSTLYLIF